MLNSSDLIDLQSVLLLLLANLVVELLHLGGVQLLHVLDLLMELLHLLDLLHVELLLSAAVLGQSFKLRLVSAEELLLGLVEALHFELMVGDLLLELSVNLEELLEFNAVVGLLLIKIILFLLKLLDVGLHSLNDLVVRFLGLLRLKHVFSLAFLLLLIVELTLSLHLVLQIIDHVLELLDLVEVDSLGRLVLILESDDLHLELLLGEHQLIPGSAELLILSEQVSLLGVPFLVQLVDILGVGLLNLLDLVHELVHLIDSLLSVRLLHGHSLLVELVDLLCVLHLLLRESLLIVADLEVVLLLPISDLRVELLDDDVVSLLHVGVSLLGELDMDLLEVDSVLDFSLLELLLELNELLALIEVPSLLLLLLLDHVLDLEDVGFLHLLILELQLLLLLFLELDGLFMLSVLVGQGRDDMLVRKLNFLLQVSILHQLLNLRVVLNVMLASCFLEILDLVDQILVSNFLVLESVVQLAGVRLVLDLNVVALALEILGIHKESALQICLLGNELGNFLGELGGITGVVGVNFRNLLGMSLLLVLEVVLVTWRGKLGAVAEFEFVVHVVVLSLDALEDLIVGTFRSVDNHARLLHLLLNQTFLSWGVLLIRFVLGNQFVAASELVILVDIFNNTLVNNVLGRLSAISVRLWRIASRSLTVSVGSERSINSI